MARKRNVYLVPTPVTYGKLADHGTELGYPEINVKEAGYVFSAGTRAIGIAKAAGIKMAFGTDLVGELRVHQSEGLLMFGQILSPAAGGHPVLDRLVVLGRGVDDIDGPGHRHTHRIEGAALGFDLRFEQGDFLDDCFE